MMKKNGKIYYMGRSTFKYKNNIYKIKSNLFKLTNIFFRDNIQNKILIKNIFEWI